MRTVGPVAIGAWFAFAVLVVAFGIGAGPGVRAAAAQVDEVLEAGIADLVELPGECGSSGPLEPGWSIDCRFALRPGAADEINDVELTSSMGDYTLCAVDVIAEIVRCPDLLAERYEPGTVTFDLFVDGMIAEAAAEVTTAWNADPSFSFTATGAGETLVFDGRPLRWSSFVYEPLDGLFVNIRDRDGGDVLRAIPLPVQDPFVSGEGAFDPELPVGRYRLWPCVGPTADSCVEQPGGQPFQVITGAFAELIEGHNRISAERINVLFVGSGLSVPIGDEPPLDLPQLAVDLLTIDGPTGIGPDGQAVGPGEGAQRLVWGPMATEPLASSIDRFNFWYLEDDIADEAAILFGGTETVGDVGFDLPNLQITALYSHPSRYLSDSRGTSFETFEPNELGQRGRLRFGDARVHISRFDPLASAQTLTHEWGHGLFGLRDEYYGFDDRPVAAGFPNCAPDEETALRWWGDQIGAVDPFAEEVVAIELERIGEPSSSDDLVERTAIEITPGGCYSDAGSNEVYRPSRDSLMNSEVPVFGAVNRRRVEAVLERFSGRGPMDALDDLTLACEGYLGRITCRGELRSHLDKPLSIVAIESIPCEFGSSPPLADGSDGPVPVNCTTIGSPAEPIDLTFRGERRAVEVVDLNPPAVPVPMESRIVPDDADTGGGNGRMIGIGVLLIVATAALAFVERRSRSVRGS